MCERNLSEIGAMCMKKISKKEFDIYVGFERKSLVFMFADEVSWYTNADNTLFATILFCFTDKDYNPIFLQRDKNRKVKHLDNDISFKTIEEAEAWINNTERDALSGKIKLSNTNTDKAGVDLFNITVPEQKLHPYFKALNNMPAHSAAKKLINEITPYFIDIDGNYVKQFQTNGFNSRLWELYLFNYFREEGLDINREYEAPDYVVSNDQTSVAVEAAIVENKTPYKDINVQKQPEYVNVEKETANKLPLNYSSQLYTKLMHKNKNNDLHYWQYAHTKGKPFVIAIADFHDTFAMNISTTALINYLYGVQHSSYHDDNGELVIVTEKIQSYVKGNGKEVSPGYFFLPGAENISAIIHSASGTLSKFDRIGKQCGFDTSNTIMQRVVTVYNPEPNADKPLLLEYIVDETCNETWAEGISVYHNPNALHPLPVDFFPSASQNFFIDGKIMTENAQNHVYSSYTYLFTPTYESENASEVAPHEFKIQN